MNFGWFRRKTARSRHERDRLRAFAAMSLNDVRRRAEEFEAAENQYHEWMQTRRERRRHPPDPTSSRAMRPRSATTSHRSDGERLSGKLRQRGAWEVGDLPVSAQLQWARKLNALTEMLSRPHHRPIGPHQPAVRVKGLDEYR